MQLLELLNMKGKHKHKWDYLRNILLERVVYDDQAHRAWYSDDSMEHGLVFACKQVGTSVDVYPCALIPKYLHARVRLYVYVLNVAMHNQVMINVSVNEASWGDDVRRTPD